MNASFVSNALAAPAAACGGRQILRGADATMSRASAKSDAASKPERNGNNAMQFLSEFFTRLNRLVPGIAVPS
jgi:hypothetical protein